MVNTTIKRNIKEENERVKRKKVPIQRTYRLLCNKRKSERLREKQLIHGRDHTGPSAASLTFFAQLNNDLKNLHIAKEVTRLQANNRN